MSLSVSPDLKNAQMRLKKLNIWQNKSQILLKLTKLMLSFATIPSTDL